MSKFSGKCDFYDEIQIFGLDYILNATIYIEGQPEPLSLNSLKDCVPYFPYIVTMASYSNNPILYLSSKSWVDIEEERYGHMRIYDLYREFLKEEMEKYSLEESD